MKKKNILYVSFLVGVIAIFAYLVMAMDVDPTTVSNMGLVSPNNSISCLNYSGSLINVTADLFSSGNGNLTNVTVFFWNGSDSSQLVFNVTLTDNDADSNMT
ncbi:hypothetical protein ACFL0E_00690, partial [Nanoarchaeota archaeon]